MNKDERGILNTAVAALERTTGIGGRILRTTTANPVIEIETARRKHRFVADIKTADRFQTPALVKARKARKPPLLVAPYVTREVADRCRQLHLPFIDTAGNVYFEETGLLVYVVGQTRIPELRHSRFRALKPAGLQIVFALLCRAELIRVNYRELADLAGVALGSIGPVLKDLEARRLIRFHTGRDRKLLNPERMLEEWVTHYPTTLRPKLNPRRFEADPERLRKLDLTPHNAYWGGEPAAERLTQYLKPAQHTIYTSGTIAKLVSVGRMRAQPNGNVEILEKFWDFPADRDIPDVVPPVLAYADLLATHDGRNVEAARMIYEERIAPVFAAVK